MYILRSYYCEIQNVLVGGTGELIKKFLLQSTKFINYPYKKKFFHVCTVPSKLDFSNMLTYNTYNFYVSIIYTIYTCENLHASSNLKKINIIYTYIGLLNIRLDTLYCVYP